MRMFPADQPRPTSSRGELTLFEALRRCPLDWSVFHSLRLRNERGWEGEGDFVLVDPQAGFLVLEVKSGLLELRGGHWHQNGRKMEEAPRLQALGFARRLREALAPSVPAFGVACAFPDCDFTNPIEVGDLRELVIGKRDLPYLHELLPRMMARALPEGARPTPNRRWVDQLKTLWGDTWVPTVSLSQRAADAEEARVPLDEKQHQLLELAGETQRALVEGAAGSGKTLVATELCRRRAARGQATQYLCFTDALAKAVARQFGSTPNLRATSVRQLAVDLLRGSGSQIPAPDKKFWDEVSLTATCDALPPEADRPAMVVVDEAQDFEPGDWMLVEALAGSRGLWVFRDERQAFWDRKLPDSVATTLGGKFHLPRSHRCPDSLTAFAARYVEPNAPATRPPETVLRVVPCAERDVVERTRHEVDTLIRNGAKPSQIVVVTLSGQTRSELFGLTRLGTHEVVHADANDAAESLVVDTFLRFKGLERPFVIVAEVSGGHVTHYETRMHIALTRATVQAIVLAPPEVVQRDPRLASAPVA